MKRLRRVILVFIVLLLAAIGLALTSTTTDRYYNSHKAISQSAGILEACEAYREHPDSDRKYPSSLADLVKPPFGGRPFLRNGEQDLIDPWGNPYRYAIVKTQQGGTELYVWTERHVDGRLILRGAKKPVGGQVEKYGLPE